MRFFFILSLFVSTLYATLQVEISAPSAVLINGHTGRIIYEKNAQEKRPPASTTKVATALYVLEQLSSYDTPLTASSGALKTVTEKEKKEGSYPPYVLEDDGSMLGIQIGEKLKLKDLLYSLLLSSGNDAANVIAEGYAGSISDFMKQMNGYLSEIGLKGTRFTNPHGLHESDHYSTAYDIALLTKKALENPEFSKIAATSKYWVSRTNKSERREITQSNALMLEGPFYYPDALGGKTGTTSKAKKCLTAAAERGDRYLISVVLGCEKNQDRYLDTIQLFECAFREKKKEKVLLPEGKVFESELLGGRSSLKAELAEDAILSFYPSERVPVKAYIQWEKMEAPVEKGEKVALLQIQDFDGNVLTSFPLFAQEKVGKSFLYTLKKFFQKENKNDQG